MSCELRLGLIPSRHIRELVVLLKFARQAFGTQPPVISFFDALVGVMETEQQRRQLDLESEFHTIPCDFDLNRLTPVSLVCLHDFFQKKRNDFKKKEPPVATFFHQLADWIKGYCQDNFEQGTVEKIRRVRRESACINSGS